PREEGNLDSQLVLKGPSLLLSDIHQFLACSHRRSDRSSGRAQPFNVFRLSASETRDFLFACIHKLPSVVIHLRFSFASSPYHARKATSIRSLSSKGRPCFSATSINFWHAAIVEATVAAAAPSHSMYSVCPPAKYVISCSPASISFRLLSSIFVSPSTRPCP